MKVLLVCLMIVGLMGCSTIPVKPISQGDLPDLKGEWEGMRYGINYTAPTELKIIEVSPLPLKAEVIFYRTWSGTVTSRLTGELKDGKLFFVARNKDYWLKLMLRSGNGKMELEGDYQWSIYGRGTVFFSKKR